MPTDTDTIPRVDRGHISEVARQACTQVFFSPTPSLRIDTELEELIELVGAKLASPEHADSSAVELMELALHIAIALLVDGDLILRIAREACTRAFYYSRSFPGSNIELDDLIQVTSSKLVKHAQEGGSETELRKLAPLIARRSRIDFYRRQLVRMRSEFGAAKPASVQYQHDNTTDAREMLLSVEHRLSEEERAILFMHFFEEEKLSVVAEFLKISARHARRIRAELRRKIQQTLIERGAVDEALGLLAATALHFLFV